MLKAGAAEIDITPEVGNNIPGQWLQRTADSVRDPCLVNALVLESGNTRLALVSVDAASLENRVVREARGLVLNVAGIPTDHVLLAATHTHTGPPVSDGLGAAADPKAVAGLAKAIADAVAAASARLGPARLAAWSGEAPGLAFPRRYHMRDGTVQMHPAKDSPELLGPEDEADPTIAGLHVWREDGALLAVSVNFACHPIVVGNAAFYSADYPGGVRRALKRQYGEQATVLYLNGPCGDVGPDNVEDASTSRYGEEWLDRIGSALAGFAIGYGGVATARDDVALATASTHVRIPIRPVPEELVAQAEATLSDDDIAAPPQDVELIKLREVLLVARERRRQDYVEAEVTGAVVGNAVLVGLPGEIFADFGRRIRADSRFAHTLVVELVNGYHGYVPTRKAFAGGGYETWLARSSKLAPEAGDMMVGAAGQLLHRLAPIAR